MTPELRIAPAPLELVRSDTDGSFFLYETPAGEFVAVVFNEYSDGYVAHRSNSPGSWLGPRIVAGYGLSRCAVLDQLEDRLEAGVGRL